MFMTSLENIFLQNSPLTTLLKLLPPPKRGSVLNVKDTEQAITDPPPFLG